MSSYVKTSRLTLRNYGQIRRNLRNLKKRECKSLKNKQMCNHDADKELYLHTHRVRAQHSPPGFKASVGIHIKVHISRKISVSLHYNYYPVLSVVSALILLRYSAFKVGL